MPESNDISNHVDMLVSRIDAEESDYNKKIIRERINRLTGGIATIYVGGSSDVEIKEKKDIIDDAISATRAAMKGGTVIGGGMALLIASDKLTKNTSITSRYRDALNVIGSSMSAPFFCILENAGEVGIKERINAIFQENNRVIISEQLPEIGFDVDLSQIVNMRKSGIIDPTLAVRSALKNSISAISTLLTTDCVIS